jgi:transcriptional antiterminator NusG
MNTIIETPTAMKWYIIRSQANRERSVADTLRKQSEKGDLIGKIGRIMVPMETSFYMKNNKKVKREKVMFPGYVFIETNSVGEIKYYLKNLNGASGFLTNRAGDVIPLSNEEADKMLGIQKVMEDPEMEDQFIVDEDVRVIDGPFSGMIGTIDEINGQKVKLSVSIFGRKTPLELNILQIEKK